MKKLLKHALLICTVFSAGALYAPDMPAATTPNDHRWWTKETIGELVSSLKLSDKRGKKMPAALLQEVVNLVPKESFSLKRLYNTMLSTSEIKRNVAGSTYAVKIIEQLARDQNLVIHLDKSDFTPDTVNDPQWWSVHYPAVNKYINKGRAPVQVISCRGLKMIVAQMNPGKGNQSLDQALKDVRATTLKNNQAQIAALNGAERIIKAAQKLAQEHSKKRPVPSLVLPALALNPTVARAQLPEDNCLYPSSSAAATTGQSETGQSKTLGMGANPQDLSSGPIDVAPEHSTKIPVSPLSLEPIPPSLESGIWEQWQEEWEMLAESTSDDKPSAKRQRTGGG